MLVYRIEHPTDGMGPYTHDSSFGNTLSNMHADDCHPSKGREFPTQHYDDNWFCCFDSVECLHIWFEGWHRELAYHGFKLAVYDIADLKVLHGKFQSIFVKESARLVRYDDIVNPF